MKKLTILTADSNGAYPVPAVKGGAVSTLIEHLVQENELQKSVDLRVISFFDSDAFEKSGEYKNTQFIWVKRNFVVRILDKMIYWIVKTFFPKKKPLSYKTIASLLHYIVFAKYFLRNDNSKLLIENNIPLSLILKNKHHRQPYYYHLHNVPRTSAMSKEVLRAADGYLCVSKYVGQQINQQNSSIGPIASNKIKILRNCIDEDVFNLQKNTSQLMKIRIKYHLKISDKILIFAGRLSPEKGVDKLLESLRYIRNVDSVKVLVIGSYAHGTNSDQSEYGQTLRQLAKQWPNKVIFTGYVPQSQMKAYYQIADIAVLPSVWEEPAGLTMLEAMACGTPVVTTDSGGIPEYVSDGAVVLERNSNLPRNIAMAVNRLFENTEMYVDYQEKAQAIIKSAYSREGYLKKLCQFIK